MKASYPLALTGAKLGGASCVEGPDYERSEVSGPAVHSRGRLGPDTVGGLRSPRPPIRLAVS